ncbi:hypothetical protein QBC41DRAFT_360500 [Cercophora samala]|uniref:CorA-like transporter domain-containing protein n=1 Tax=Cercophora samala TaxID=330535 RepID=A0AA39YUI8_9PEZI|nr:hypothetical protein QBC41DRAFT_360500 [Cercophora samala]
MAKLLFTFHQVDPSFLGFVYNLYFGYGYQHADFSISKFLPAIDTSPTPSTFLNRSGRVICHSFLLRGVQEGHDWREDCCNDSWVRLQVVAYHSFDIKTGTMTWITLRASSELTGRIRVADSKSFAKLDSIDNVEGAFEASLTTHLTYIDWSAANWVYLANEIDRRLRDTLWVLKVITSTPYEPDMRTTYRSPYRQGRTIMRLAKRRSPYSLVVEEIYLRGTEDEDRAAGFFLRPFSNHDVCGVMHHGLAPLLERLQRLDLDLELNIDALNSMCQRYEGLKTDQDLGSELPRASKTSIDKFVSRVRLIIDNLTGRQKHLLSLQSRIREARTLYESIARFRTAESNMDDDIPPCPEPESAQPKEE